MTAREDMPPDVRREVLRDAALEVLRATERCPRTWFSADAFADEPAWTQAACLSRWAKLLIAYKLADHDFRPHTWGPEHELRRAFEAYCNVDPEAEVVMREAARCADEARADAAEYARRDEWAVEP